MAEVATYSPAVARAIEQIRALDATQLRKRPSLLKGIVVGSLSADEQVAQGASWLDQTEPGWHRRIDKDSLDLGSDGLCIFGQLDGEYTKGVNRRFKRGPNTQALNHLMGFNLLGYYEAMKIDRQHWAERPHWTDLNEAWHREIATRLAADTVAQQAAEQADAQAVMGDPKARYI